MNNNYEKHQRDYTVMATTTAFQSVFSDKMSRFFSFRPRAMYILVKNGILYHFVSKLDYANWGKTWLEDHSLQDLIKYEKEMDEFLEEYSQFLKSKHQDLETDILKTNEYIDIFMPIILIAAYVLPYAKGRISKQFAAKLLEIRKKYDNVHKNSIDLQIKLLERLEKKDKLVKNSLFYLTHNEFKHYLQTKNLPKNILKRKELFFLKYSTSQIKIYSEKEYLKQLKKIEGKAQDLKNVREIYGTIAQPGSVKGRVRIIQLIKDVKYLKTGEVLVASMTDPRYLTAMKKAAAFITDEGGITCHAAIVARELGKPCIIGTKIATLCLKNGDLVRVDANKGIIKMLNK